MNIVFRSLLGHIRMGFEPGTLPLTRDRVRTACARLFTLCQTLSFCVGMSFPISDSACFFVLISCAIQWPSGIPPTFSISDLWERRESCCCSTRVVHVDQVAYISCWGHLLVIRDQCTPLKLILLYLFSMWVKALFHLVLDYSVFSPVTPIPNAVGRTIPDGWYYDDFCYPPCSWSSPLALVMGA